MDTALQLIDVTFNTHTIALYLPTIFTPARGIFLMVCVLTPGLVVGGQITPYGQQNYVAGAAENVGATDSGSYRQHRAIVPDGYRQELAPRPPDGSPLLVNFSIKVNGITEADGRQTAVVLDTYFRMMWKDWRLRYPETDKNDEEDDLVEDKEEKVRKTIVDPIILEKIWLPDPSILSVRKVYLVSVLKKVQGVILFSDGTVFVSTVLKIELECSTMFSKFPFDVQECPLDIHSYMYEVTELEMRWVPQGLSVDPRVSNQLSNYDHRFTMYPDNITCLCYKCIPPESPCVRAMLVLSRKALGHILATFLPSGLFVAVSWASLFWPSDVIPGRTVLVITALLTLVSMHSAVRQSGPETSYVKAVDVWMFMCVLLSTCVLFEYGIVLFIRKQRVRGSVSAQVTPPVTQMVAPKNGPAMEYNNNALLDRLHLYEEKLERTIRIFIPFVFLLFNLIYWPYYLI